MLYHKEGLGFLSKQGGNLARKTRQITLPRGISRKRGEK